MLGAEHVYFKTRDPLTPAPLSVIGPHPAPVKTFCMANMVVEIADKQGIFSGRQQGSPDITGEKDLCGFVIEMEITR